MAIAEVLAEQQAFSAGEVSPRLRNRRDLARHQMAAERIENLVTLLEGGLTRCPGTQMVQPLGVEAERGRLIPFRLSIDDAWMLVFNGNKLRILRDGGYLADYTNPEEPPLEIDTPWSAGNLDGLRFAQQYDTQFYAWAGRPKILKRADGGTWTISNYAPEVGPVDPQNLDTDLTLQASAELGSAITIETSDPNMIVAADIGTTWRIDEADLDLVPLWEAGETGLEIDEERRWNGNVYRVHLPGDGKAGTVPPTHVQGVVQAGKGKVKWKFLHRGFGTVRIDEITDTTHVVARVTSRLPKSVVDGPTYRWWPSAWSDAKGWPSVVTMHQGRLWWFRGDQYWPTKAEDLFSFEATLTDEGSFPGRLRSPDGGLVSVQWALSGGVLVLGVRDGEWLLRASNPMDPITLTDFLPLPDGSEGSAPQIPVLVDGGAVFIGKNRQRLHSIHFDRESERLEEEELSLAARHLIARKAVRIAYQRDPNRLLWFHDEAGRLASFTYLPKDNILAGQRRPIAGQVEDIATLPSADGTETELYLIVQRTINGENRRFVERLMPFFEPADPDNPLPTGAWFVDCGVRVESGTPFQSIGNLGHLEGETVAINIDGYEHPRRVVENAEVTFDRPTLVATVGLPLPWLVKSLPFEVDLRSGSSKGKKKRANHAIVDVIDSLGGFARFNGGEPEPMFETGDQSYGALPVLFTGPRRVTMSSPSEDEGVMEVFGSGTLPFTLGGVAPDLDIGDA